MRKHTAAFTLVELLIVVSIIAIIAAMAIPNLLASRLSANETAAIAALRSVASAQSASQTRGAVDLDGDGYGEFLYLAELSGTVDLRGSNAPLDPAAVSVGLGTISNSVGNKSGYLFAMFLPDSNGAGVPEDPNGGKAAAGDVDTALAETFWVCYAWPSTYSTSGTRAFVINQSGNILQTSNTVQEYSGTANPPAASAAYVVAGDITSDLSVSGVPAPASDGGLWLPVN